MALIKCMLLYYLQSTTQAPVWHHWPSNGSSLLILLFLIEKPKLFYCSLQEAKIGSKIRIGSGLNILKKSILGRTKLALKRQIWKSVDRVFWTQFNMLKVEIFGSTFWFRIYFFTSVAKKRYIYITLIWNVWKDALKSSKSYIVLLT